MQLEKSYAVQAWGRSLADIVQIFSERRNTPINEEILTKKDSKIRNLERPQSETAKRANDLKMILLYSNASLIRNKDNDGYGCNYCTKKFEYPKHLKDHFLQVHSNVQALEMPKPFQYVIKIDITGLKCKICDTRIANLADFTEHLKAVHSKNITTGINEIIPFKFDSEELHCAICGTKYSSFKILQEHMHNHFRNHVCEICNAGFITKRLLVSHIRRHGEGEFKCDHCDRTYVCDQKRRDHELRIHLGLKKRNKCKFCDEKFEDYWTKMRHMVEKHDAPPISLKCTACDRAFTNQRSLSRHVRKDHLLERRHDCNICDMQFFSKYNLVDHIDRIHTGIKKIQCQVCNKQYASKKSLRQHLRSHTNDRRFACVTCGVAFVQKCTLKSHMKSKHGKEIT